MRPIDLVVKARDGRVFRGTHSVFGNAAIDDEFWPPEELIIADNIWRFVPGSLSKRPLYELYAVRNPETALTHVRRV